MSRKIKETDVLQAWQDLMTEGQPIVERDGYTTRQLSQLLGVPINTVRTRIRRLCEQCKLRQIGVRPDRNRSPVYEIES